MVHPHFFAMVERFCGGGGQLKIETNGHYLTPPNCERLAALGIKAVQVSLDGASRATFNRMRVRGEFNTAVDGTRNLRAAGVPIRSQLLTSTCFNVEEIGSGRSTSPTTFGAYSFYTGRTMYTGNADKAWRHLAPSEEQIHGQSFDRLRAKAEEYRTIARELLFPRGGLAGGAGGYRLREPAALLIVLAEWDLVKLINALPFICGDLRHQAAGDGCVWGQSPARPELRPGRSRGSWTTSADDPAQDRDAAARVDSSFDP